MKAQPFAIDVDYCDRYSECVHCGKPIHFWACETWLHDQGGRADCAPIASQEAFDAYVAGGAK